MSFDEIVRYLSRLGYSSDLQVDIVGAINRARNRIARSSWIADNGMYFVEPFIGPARIVLPHQRKTANRVMQHGMRIVLRPGGVVRAEINKGRVRGGSVVGVVSKYWDME